ncbi:FAD-binding oxidoreductase [Oxyplasma meridianum]|uniref:FAD-binding oxidoreductase n=1 Tax=Oxyplasma meridianum TaxID=3073602 RepID=A0AAX4NFA1_9ARCH
MALKWDLAVIGSGIVGLSSAYHIMETNPGLKVVIIDKARTFAQGNTGKSAAGFRDLFSSDINYKLSSSSIAFYRHIQNDLGVNLGMHTSGYLYLLDNETASSNLFDSVIKRSKSRFVTRDGLAVFDSLNFNPDKDAAEIMNLKPVDQGFLGENCGIIEPDLIAGFYYNNLIKMGVKFMFDTTVNQIMLSPTNPLNYPGEPFIWQDLQVKSLNTDKGEIEAERYLVAADVWTTNLLDRTGIDSHIRPKKRQVFQISGGPIQKLVRSPIIKGERIMPFLVLPSHEVYMRPVPQNNSIWVGVADNYNRDFSFSEDPQPEPDFYQNNIYPVLDAYIKDFDSARVTASWAGYYSYNTIDLSPYVFGELNLIVSTGTSGSGILKGDAIGRVVAARFNGSESADLYGGEKLKPSTMGIRKRVIDREEFIL